MSASPGACLKAAAFSDFSQFVPFERLLLLNPPMPPQRGDNPVFPPLLLPLLERDEKKSDTRNGATLARPLKNLLPNWKRPSFVQTLDHDWTAPKIAKNSKIHRKPNKTHLKPTSNDPTPPTPISS